MSVCQAVFAPGSASDNDYAGDNPVTDEGTNVTANFSLSSNAIIFDPALTNTHWGMGVGLSQDGSRGVFTGVTTPSNWTSANPIFNLFGTTGSVRVIAPSSGTFAITETLAVPASITNGSAQLPLATRNSLASYSGVGDAADVGTGYGFSAAISGDGNTIAVGAPAYYESSSGNIGAVVVFRRTSGTWALEQIITPDSGTTSTWLGYSVALSYSGDHLLAGAPWYSGVDSGIHTLHPSPDDKAILFKRTGTSWSQLAVFEENASPYNAFGRWVALPLNAKYCVVSSGGTSGGTHLYQRNQGWSKVFSLASERGPVAAGESRFCVSVNPGTSAIAPTDMKRYEFIDGAWQADSTAPLFTQPAASNISLLGYSVAASNNLNRTAIGDATRYTGSSDGVYIVRNRPTGSWNPGFLTRFNNYPIVSGSSADIAWSVAVSGNGRFFMTGSPANNSGRYGVVQVQEDLAW